MILLLDTGVLQGVQGGRERWGTALETLPGVTLHTLFFFLNYPCKDPVGHLLAASPDGTPFAHRSRGSPQELLDEGTSEIRPDMEASRREARLGGVGSRS